ncbi:hypothetical protein JCM19233_3272 [Vibrio astriarenae]|nr:hypothetical protein JCM19233_3272 [Vibrio sp. C7]
MHNVPLPAPLGPSTVTMGVCEDIVYSIVFFLVTTHTLRNSDIKD